MSSKAVWANEVEERAPWNERAPRSTGELRLARLETPTKIVGFSKNWPPIFVNIGGSRFTAFNNISS